MFSIKKFYDVAEVETGSGGETATLEQPTESKPSLAALMAKSGTKVTDISNNEPIETTKSSEQKQETKIDVKDEKPVETTTTQTKNVEKGELETPKKQEEAKAETPKPPIGEVKKAEPTLQEFLKQQPKTEVLKALGYDEKVVSFMNDLKELDPKVIALLDTYKTNGDLKGYLRELTTDYSKMSSEEVMRHQLRQEYPKASEAALNALFKKEIVNAYNLDSDDPAEVEEGKLLLDAKADNYRDKFIANQQNFLLPKPTEAKTEPEQNEQERIAEQRQQQEFDAYKSTIETDPYSKNVFDKKEIVIGDFKYPVDVESLKGVLYDPSKWTETQFNIEKNADGTIKSATPKVENQILTAAFAQNPQKFLEAYAKIYKSLGGKAAIEPIENAKDVTVEKNSNGQKKPASIAEAMAKGGVITDGTFQ